MAEFTFDELDTIVQNASRTLQTSQDADKRRRAQQAIDAARRLRLGLARQRGEVESLGRMTGSGAIAQAEGVIQGFADLGIGLATGARAVGNFIGAQLGELAPGPQQGVAQSGSIGQRFSEALAQARGTTQAVREDAPLAEIAGGLTGIAGLARRGVQALSRAPQVVRNLLGRRQGQPVANVARAVGLGGAAGAAASASQSAVEGGDVGRSAVAGGAVGAVAGPVAGGIANLGVRAIQRLAGSDEAAFRILSRIAGEPAEVLQERADEFRRLVGREPTVAEIVSREAAEQVGEIGRIRPRAGQIIRERGEEIALRRQETLPAALTGGRVQTTVGRQEARRTASINRQFSNIADRPVTITEDIEDFLTSANVRALLRPPAISPERAERIRSALENRGTITVRDLEEIRRAATRIAGEGGGDFREVAATARELLASQAPEAEQALLEQATRGERIAGVQIGQRILQPEGAEDFADLLAARQPLAAQRGAGARAGARRALAQRSGESARGAQQVARQLATDRGVRRRLEQVFSADEAQRIRRIGEIEARSVRNIAAASPSGRLVEPSLGENAVELAGGALGIGTGRGSLGFQLNTIERALASLRLPPNASRRLAEALVDPTRTDEAIAVLRRIGIGEDQLSQIINAANIAGGAQASNLQ